MWEKQEDGKDLNADTELNPLKLIRQEKPLMNSKG